MSNPIPPRPTHEYSESDWNQIRSHFMGSMLVDVHLHKLAQNAGTSWPLKEADETPAKYIEYEFEELAELPSLTSPHGSRVNLLLDILKETLAFDDPFGDMVSPESKHESQGQAPLQFLTRNKIPEDFPFAFVRLSPETKTLCESDQVETLADSVRFLQRMAQTVILSGEVRHFLNSLADSDEEGIAHYLPYRPGTKGLHLPEAFAQAIQARPADDLETIVALLSRKKAPKEEDQHAVELEASLRDEINRFLPLFPEETAKLKETIETEGSAERFFIILNLPEIEKVAALVAAQIFPPPQKAQEKTSFFSTLAGFFRKK